MIRLASAASSDRHNFIIEAENNGVCHREDGDIIGLSPKTEIKGILHSGECLKKFCITNGIYFFF